MLNSSPAMDFSFQDHQLLIRDTVRTFMQTEVRPHVKHWEQTDHFPLEAIKKLAALGCCGMLMPEEWGGPGLDTLSYVLMLEEVAKVHTALCTAIAVTNSAVQLPLLAHGTQKQKERYLHRLAAGEILGSFCLTEPSAGSDAAGIQTTATPQNTSRQNKNNCHPEPAHFAGEGPAFSSSSPGAPGADVAPGLLGSSSTTH